MKNGMGLSVVGYAVYCKSDNILRAMANKMALKVGIAEWNFIEIEWQKRNIENIVKMPQELVVGFREKALKCMVKKMITKPPIVDDDQDTTSAALPSEIFAEKKNLNERLVTFVD